MKDVTKLFKIDYHNLDNDQIYLSKENFLKYLSSNSIYYQKLKKNINETIKISLDPETPLEDIRIRALLDTLNRNSNTVIISYVCKFNNNLEEDFLKELAFITSGIFDFQYYNRKHINTFMDLIGSNKNKNDILDRAKYLQLNQETLRLDSLFIENIFKTITETKRDGKVLYERVDWNWILFRKICSDRFFERYNNLFNSYYANNPANFKEKDYYS
jgi:hypothetical protein